MAQERWMVSRTISGERLPERVIIMLADEHGLPIMEPPIAECGYPTAEVLARAALIAQAPTLLAALEGILASAGYTTGESPPGLRQLLVGRDYLDQARAAVRQAKGE